MRHSRIALTLSISILAGTASSQLPSEQVRAAGLGAIQLTFDAATPTANDLLLGCAYVANRYYVTGRDAVSAFHQVYVFDATGASVGQFDQIESSATSDWGYRDGATDGTSLLFGSENGVFVIDTNGNLLPPGGAVIAANGAQNLAANPIVGAVLTTLGTIRGLAYNPDGNGGNGSLWAGSFGSDLIEFDLDGNILTTLPNQGQSTFGLAWDSAAATLWVSSAGGSGAIAEVDPATGAFTSNTIERFHADSAQGGLSVGPGNSLVGLDQAVVDRVTVYRNHLVPSLVLGKDEERLLIGVNNGTPGDSQFRCAVGGAMVSYEVTGGTFTGMPNATIFNFGAESLLTGTTLFGPSPIPELVAISDASMPTGFNIMVGGSNGTALGFTVPNAILLDRELIRMQAVYVTSMMTIMATNQVYLEYALSPTARVRVEAIGSSSRNANSTTGFFSVSHLGNTTASITRVDLSWVGSSNAAQVTMEWDTDSEGMGGRFDGGNSTVVGCEGTYRNDSDVLTGLDYSVSDVSPCDPSARTGWTASDAGNSLGDWRTLTFRFSSGSFVRGEVFEFDADTDHGQGFTGADMDGLRATITFSDGTVLNGELVLDAMSAIPRALVDL